MMLQCNCHCEVKNLVCIFWYLNFFRSNNQIFIKNYVGRTWPKEEVSLFGKVLDHILETKKIFIFYRSHFQCIYNDFGFWLLFH